MRIGIVSDIHSNFEALRAVCWDMRRQRVKIVYCLGDVVGYGPFPEKCLKIIKKISSRIILGNHDDCACCQVGIERRLNDLALEGIKYSIEKLSLSDVDFFKKLPLQATIKDFDLSLAHASFSNPAGWDYVDSPQKATEELKKTPTRICVIGHTHVSYVFGNKEGLYNELPEKLVLDPEQKFLINVGSVGQPRDGDCRASYGILDYAEDGAIFFYLRQVFYNIEKTKEAMKKNGLPPFLYERLFRGE